MRKHPLALVAGLALTLAACASTRGGSAPAAPPSLFDRLGGKKAVHAVVDDFLARVGKDTRINRFFEGVDLGNLNRQLYDQICEATGGPCRYEGADMKSAHEGLGIAGSDFDAMVEDLVATLDQFQVPKKEQDELLAILGPMKKDIVEK